MYYSLNISISVYYYIKVSRRVFACVCLCVHCAHNVYFLSVGSRLGLGRVVVEVVVVLVTGYTPRRGECENTAQDVREHTSNK